MILINCTRDNFTLKYPLEQIAPLDSVLFFDIETTGFLARSSQLYLIGCAYYQDNSWNIVQWLAQNTSEEALILKEFLAFAKNYTTLIHFNGAQFDIPYIKQKCQQYSLIHPLDDMLSFDIYKGISPYKTILNLPNCKQKTLEAYLGIQRNDLYDGGELIDIYKNYCKNPTDDQKELLLLHNFEDVCGMLDCLPLLLYADLFAGSFEVDDAWTDDYKGLSGELRSELIISLALKHPLPTPLIISKDDVFVRMAETGCQIKIPIYSGELKYFYPNYKDYYYLPLEDKALHKSVAGYMDKAFRKQATANNCYTRKTGNYLPQWSPLFEPSFKKEYKDTLSYFELTKETTIDKNAIYEYATQILKNMAM